MLSPVEASRSLAFGLLCFLPLSLLDRVASASIPSSSDAVTLKSAIALKINTGTLRSSLTGAEIVEGLVSKAQAGNKPAKRDVNFNVLPLINSLTSERLAEMVQRATELDPTYEPTDFGAWYQVQFDSEANERDPEITQLLVNLAENDEVVSCQRLAGASAPNVQYQDDPRFPEQGYLGPSDAGINAQYAWGFPGGDGAGTTIIDIERGWQLDHEDLVCIADASIVNKS